MKLEFALKAILERYKMRRQGVVSDLAATLGVGPQYMSKILNNHTTSFQNEHIEKVCEWLIENAPNEQVRQELRAILPGALFEFAGLWDSLLKKKSLVLYLGERRQSAQRSMDSAPSAITWLSGMDSAAATEVVHRLSRDGAEFAFSWKNVPFHVAKSTASAPANIKAKDQEYSAKMFEDLERLRDSIVLVIGSQRVNLMVEQIAGQILGCKPFREPQSSSLLPLYMQFRDQMPVPPSCFGGQGAPPGIRRSGTPGIYYRENTEWCHLPCSDSTDAGVAIVVDDRHRNVVELVLFGFSSWGTLAISRLFCDQPEMFWPLPNRIGTRNVGIFCCSFPVPTNASDQPDDEHLNLTSFSSIVFNDA